MTTDPTAYVKIVSLTCCTTFSFLIETFHHAGKLLKKEGKELKIASGNPNTVQIHQASPS